MKSIAPIAMFAAAARAQYTCADGLYMVVARGTGEDPGPGEMGRVADLVADKIEGSRVVGLDYPATLGGDGYMDSVMDGQSALKTEIEGYSKACPDGKIAVMGYSQGAQVSADVLCGGSGKLFDEETPLDSKIVDSSIVAILLFGDPSFVNGTSYDKGTGNNEGIFPRTKESVAQCEKLGDKIASYCDYGDRYCDTGEYQNKTVHSLYAVRYGEEASNWVVQRYEDFEKDEISTGTATATTSALSTATEIATSTGTDTASTTTGSAPVQTTTDAGASGIMTSLYAAPLLALGLWQLL